MNNKLKQLLSLVAIAAMLFTQACSPKTGPDTIFINGEVYTVDAGNSKVQAVAVTDG